jgi:RecA/RadA recombinase
VKLIVIDSLAFHFRHDLENTALRSRVLHKIAAELSRMAVDFGTAVNIICINKLMDVKNNVGIYY